MQSIFILLVVYLFTWLYFFSQIRMNVPEDRNLLSWFVPLKIKTWDKDLDAAVYGKGDPKKHKEGIDISESGKREKPVNPPVNEEVTHGPFFWESSEYQSVESVINSDIMLHMCFQKYHWIIQNHTIKPLGLWGKMKTTRNKTSPVTHKKIASFKMVAEYHICYIV